MATKDMFYSRHHSTHCFLSFALGTFCPLFIKALALFFSLFLEAHSPLFIENKNNL